MERGLDGVVVFPPPYVYSELQPGIAAIAGSLRNSGFNFEIIDANIGGLEYVLKSVDECAANNAISVLRDPSSYTPDGFERFRAAKDTIEKLSREASRRNGEEFSLRRNTLKYTPVDDAQSRMGILAALKDPKKNLFYDYFVGSLLPKLKGKLTGEGDKVVGIGVTDRKQAIPGFVLGDLIKQTIPNARVVIGGNFVGRGRDAFTKDDDVNRELFEHVDYLMILEGDSSFVKLSTAIRDGTELIERSKIPKLVYLEGKGIKHNPMGSSDIIDIQKLPLPSFEGLDSWTPEKAAAYNFQRGCLYGKCSFCGLMDGYDGFSKRSEDEPTVFVPRKKTIDSVIEDVQELRRQGFKYINFPDETFFAADMEKFSKRLVEEGIDIKWTAYARVEDRFTDSEFCKLLAKAGCEFLQFGVESGSVKSLNLMDKGTDNFNVDLVLKNTYKAGIMNHAFLMVGYPGEEIEDALQLFPFLERSGDNIFTLKPTWYKLARGSPDSYRLQIKGLERTFTEGDLSPNLHFNKTSGMSKKAAQAVNDLLESYIRRKHIRNYVAGTYCYGQRFSIGPSGILEIERRIRDGKIRLPKEFTPDADYTFREKSALHVVWKELVGEGYLKAKQKYENGNRNPQFIEAYERLRKGNVTAREFPQGFETIEDVVKLSYLVGQKFAI